MVSTKQKAINLMIKLAESCGHISQQQSLETQLEMQQSVDGESHVSHVIKQLKLDLDTARLLWKIAKTAPILSKQSQEIDSISATRTFLSFKQLEPKLQKEVFLADQLLRQRLVEIDKVNAALKEVQKQKNTLSLGQILIRQHLLKPEEFVQLAQQASQPDPKLTINSRISRNQKTGIIELILPDTLIFIGKYEVIREIARGGMGVVYEARDTQLNRVVALKTLIAGELADSKEIERFQREAKLAASFNHAGIVPIYEVGIHENTHYFTMDYIDGISLAEYVRKTKCPLRKILKMAAQVADALNYAHNMGIIHRDIKPANILVDTNGRPMLTDFGLARQQDGKKGLTMSGVALGTPSYMSPEQALGKIRQIDVRSDIYSLGAVVYELLAGRPPFTGTSLADTLQAVIHEDAVPLRQLVPGLPVDVETICMKCLEKDKRRRYQNAKGLIRDIERFLRGENIRARRLSLVEVLAKWAKRNKITLIVSSTFLLLLALFFNTKMADVSTIEKSRKMAVQAKKQAEEKAREAEAKAREAARAKARAEIKAQEALQEKQQAKKNSAQAHMYKGTLLLQLDRIDESIEALSQAINLDPNLDMAYAHRGVVYYKQGNSQAAIRDLSKAIQLNPRAYDVYNNRALVYFANKQYAQAIDDFNKAIKFTSKLSQAQQYTYLFYRGVAYMKIKNYQKALQDFNRVLQLQPKHKEARFSRANIYMLQKKYRNALADYELCALYNPDYKKEQVTKYIAKLRAQ